MPQRLLAAPVSVFPVSLEFCLFRSKVRYAANYYLTPTRSWEVLIGAWLSAARLSCVRRAALTREPIVQSCCEASFVIPCTSRSFAFKILASALEADPDPIATQSLVPAHVGPSARSKPEGAIDMHDELSLSHRDHRTVRIHHSNSAWERTWRYRS